MAKEKMTAEQKRAAELQRMEEKYRSHCVESHKFTQNEDNLQDFDRLIEIQAQMKVLKSESDSLRAKILQAMKNCLCDRAINLKHRKQLTISSGKSSTKKEFDLERFKREQPEMYEKYRRTTRVGGVGGNLVCKDITDKAYSFYSRPENSKYFQSIHLEKPQLDKDYGSVFSIEEFRELVVSGCITDYDGFGEYYDDNLKAPNPNAPVDLDEIEDGTHPKQYHFVVWYNN